MAPIGAIPHRLDRRMFLTEFGRRTFAVTILGAAVLSCGSDDEPSSAPNTTRGTEPDATTSTAAPTTAALTPLEWERVNLGFVSAYVLVRGNEAAVVDSGVPGSEAQIAEALTGLSLGWADVDHLVLTHLHPDHSGSAAAVLMAAEDAIGYAGEADIPAIQVPRALTPVGDGDEVFGLQVIATPGHTAGHISVLDTETGLLVVGDALNNSGPDGVTGSISDFTADPVAADETVQKLAELDFDTVLFGHGEPVEGGAGEQVAALAASI